MGKMWLLLVWNQESQLWVPHQYSFYRVFLEEIEDRLADNGEQTQIILTDYEPRIFNVRGFANPLTPNSIYVCFNNYSHLVK